MVSTTPGEVRRYLPRFKPEASTPTTGDVLETLQVLVGLGYAGDPRLEEATRWLLGKQDRQGRWKLENSPAARCG